jgi:hypothetical protein
MLTKEYRIPLPLTVAEYQIAQLYMVSKISKQQTGHGEGIQILENKPFDDENGKGQYTHKILHIGSRIPAWLKMFVPTTALQVDEKAWNAYPYCKTVYSCPFLGDRFSISVTTKYLPDNGSTVNPLGRSEAELKDRTVDVIDIANDPIDISKYKPEEDPTIYVSEKTGRGKLTKDWISKSEPIMCSYKECSVHLKIWGVQTAGESYIHKVALRDVFLQGHRQVFCWLDEWFGKSIEDMRKIEEETKMELDLLMTQEDGAGAEVPEGYEEKK